jgi:hypothetical protein
MSRVREKMERFRREREVSEEWKVEKHSYGHALAILLASPVNDKRIL